MNRFTLCLFVAATSVGLVSASIADDTNTDRPIKTHKQKMHECMAKERQNDAGASAADMKKRCNDKIQSYDQHPSETTTPPNNP